MAAVVATADMTILKNTQILVNVEEALSDILVVSYSNENRQFQGVLLDSSKRNLPFGVAALHPAFSISEKCSNGKEDKLYSASQRFVYEDPDYRPKTLSKPKQQQQRAKMTVRLRPRKVLCSKCKGICNENSENVAQTRKHKDVEYTAKDKKGYGSEPTGRSNKKEDNRTLIMGHSLIPKLSRLHPNEITNAMNGNVYARNEIWIQQSDVEKSDTNLDIDELSSKNKISDGSGDSNMECATDDKSEIVYSSSEGHSESRFIDDSRDHFENDQRKQRKCRQDEGTPAKKKRAESFLDLEETSSSMFSNARTLKISFGEGEGTVLKIPAMTGDFCEVGGDSDSASKSSSRAAKRALRKAKKQARRHASPAPQLSPPHLSPQPAYQIFQRRHKHKVRFNKKKRGPYKEGVNSSLDTRALDPLGEDPLAPSPASLITPLSPPPIDVLS